MITFGVTQLFRGLRRGNAALAVTGALLILAGYMRRGPLTQLVHTEKMRVGDELRVRVVPDQATR